MGPSRCSAVVLLTLLISPIDGLPQSKASENSSGSAWGRVLFGSEDRPIHHAQVEFTLPSTQWTGVLFTDGNGHFELQGLSPGTYQVKVTAPGFEKLVRTAQVAGRTGPTDLRLRRAHRAAVVRSDHVVSVRELRISGGGGKEYDKGTRLLVKGNTRESIPFLTRAITENPEHYRAYYNLGVAHFRLGHLADAEQAFQKSIDLTRGDYALPQFAMGMLLYQEQEFLQAEMLIQNGLDADPDSARGKYLLAWAQFGLNHLAEAEKSIQQALSREANLAGAYFLLARIHRRQNDEPAAERDLSAYFELDPHGAGNAEARAFLESTNRASDQKPDPAMVAEANP